MIWFCMTMQAMVFLITKIRSIITKRFLKRKNSWRRWDIYPNNTPLSHQLSSIVFTAWYRPINQNDKFKPHKKD